MSDCDFVHPNPHEWLCVTHDVLVIGSPTQEPVVCNPDAQLNRKEA